MLRPTPKLNTGRGRWMVLLFSFHSTRPPPPPRPNSLIHKSLRLRLQLTSNVIPTTFSPPRPLNSSVHHPNRSTHRPQIFESSRTTSTRQPHQTSKQSQPHPHSHRTTPHHHASPPPLSTDDNRTRAQDFPTGLSVRRVVSTNNVRYSTYKSDRSSVTEISQVTG